jgi:hypothetical protein
MAVGSKSHGCWRGVEFHGHGALHGPGRMKMIFSSNDHFTNSDSSAAKRDLEFHNNLLLFSDLFGSQTRKLTLENNAILSLIGHWTPMQFHKANSEIRTDPK